jgi:putative salt-induced outer membrane protein YdiY
VKNKVLSLLAMAAVATSPVFADRVELANGDQLTGTVLKKSGDTLTIETEHAGQVKVEWAQVQRLDIDKPLQFTLSDGNAIQGTLELSGNSASVTGADGGRVAISRSDIQDAGPIPPSGPPALVWHGEALAAATVVRGNTDTDAYHLGSRVVGEQKTVRRYTVTAEFNRESDEGETTKDQYLLGGKYDRFFSDVWYGYLGADFEKDKFKNLDLRSVFSAGVGHQFYNEDDLKLSLEGGLTYTDDNFREGADDRYAGVSWGLNWEQRFLDGALAFFHRHRGIKGLDSADNFVINAETGIKIPLVAGFNATAEYDVDYDNDPPAGVEKTDSTYILGIGYTW